MAKHQCHLIVTYPQTPAGKAWAGTGSLIGSKHVLTAGHVLHKAAEGGWAKSILVIPGRDGSSPPPFGSELLTWPNFKPRSPRKKLSNWPRGLAEQDGQKRHEPVQVGRGGGAE